MEQHLKGTAIFCLILLTVGIPPLQALWTGDGVEICTATGYQWDPTVIPDGAGGAIIAWEDWRNASDYDIYARKINACGETEWNLQGVPVCTETGNQQNPQLASDGAGGAIITWQDFRTGVYNGIYAQRITANGVAQWGAGGIPICEATGNQINPQIISDGAGGAIIAWQDRYTGDYDIYAQRVSTGGTEQWAADGVPLHLDLDGDEQKYPKIVSDGAGGAIVVWEDEFDNIYAQRVNASGFVQWGMDAAVVCALGSLFEHAQLIADGTGGAFIAWDDSRDGGTADIYAQRISASGTVQWTENGQAVSTAIATQGRPVMTLDGAEGVIIAWHDYRNISATDIYSQRLDANGSALWTADGIPVCTAQRTQSTPQIDSDGAGGAIITWPDYRNGSEFHIYAQRVSSGGSIQWMVDGVRLCMDTHDQSTPWIASDGAGGAVIAWEDWRNGNQDIFAQQISRDGLVGYRAPEINSVLDVPGDEGGWVNVAWDASRYDPNCNEITEYTIWRALGTPSAALLLSEGATLLNSTAEIANAAVGPVVRMELLGGQTYYWELIDSHIAYYLEGYSKIVPTAFDSSAVTSNYHYFQIIAHTSNPVVFYISDPDSGYSVDNIAPAAPVSLSGEQMHLPEGLMLTWNPNTEADLANYAVYRGLDIDFIPGPGNLLASPSDPMTIDGDWRWDNGFFYKVAAVDVHGNESQYALLGPNDVTGDDPPETPLATYLTQNFPNPFNPSTTIHFGLKESANVSLYVYDAAGRLVRVLVQERREAGIYKETWDGLDDSGRAVASGVYFYNINAGVFRETKKMVLMR